MGGEGRRAAAPGVGEMVEPTAPHSSFVCIGIYTYICVDICLYINMYMYISVYASAPIHTYIHMSTYMSI